MFLNIEFLASHLLCLFHQIEFVDNNLVPSDLSLALVVDRMEVNRLHERLTQLQAEKTQQKDLYVQARQQHVKLVQNCKEFNTKIQGQTH